MARKMLQTIQRFLRLYRPIKVGIPLSLDAAKRNIVEAFSQSIILSGKYQVTRRYWGKFSQDQIQFYGPKANKQFCFAVTGQLTQNGSHIVFTGDMYLSKGDRLQLFAAVITICGFLAAMLRWAAIYISPIFISFIYMMVQWHFQFYTKEITQILTNLMLGEEPKSGLLSNR